MRAPFAVAVAALAVLLLAAPAGAGYHPCGTVVASGDTWRHVRAQGASCRTARRVVRGYAADPAPDEGWWYLDRPVGWRCRYLVLPVRFYCRRGRAAVRFDPGPYF